MPRDGFSSEKFTILSDLYLLLLYVKSMINLRDHFNPLPINFNVFRKTLVYRVTI